MTEEQIQPQSAVDSQPKFQKPRKQKVRKDPNAPAAGRIPGRFCAHRRGQG